MYSIIVPAFNEEKYIGKCIQSLQQLDFNGKIEIVVVNNNSTDRTSEIAGQYNVIVVNQKRLGAAAARNKGARIAHGNILVFVDADVVLKPNYLQVVKMTFDSHLAPDCVAGPHTFYDGGIHARWGTSIIDYYTYYFLFMKWLTGVQGFSGGNMAIRKTVFEDVGMFDENITNANGAEDLALAIKLKNKRYHVVWERKMRAYTSYRRYKNSEIGDRVKRLRSTVRLFSNSSN